jgi:hypothetical protein
MEFAWLDGWLCDLKAAVERSILARRPNIPADRLAKLSAVDYVQDGKYHWVLVAGQIRFAVRDEDGTILGVEADVIRKDRNFGRVGQWESWDWASDPPRQIQDRTA